MEKFIHIEVGGREKRYAYINIKHIVSIESANRGVTINTLGVAQNGTGLVYAVESMTIEEVMALLELPI